MSYEKGSNNERKITKKICWCRDTYVKRIIKYSIHNFDFKDCIKEVEGGKIRNCIWNPCNNAHNKKEIQLQPFIKEWKELNKKNLI